MGEHCAYVLAERVYEACVEKCNKLGGECRNHHAKNNNCVGCVQRTECIHWNIQGYCMENYCECYLPCNGYCTSKWSAKYFKLRWNKMVKKVKPQLTFETVCALIFTSALIGTCIVLFIAVVKVFLDILGI